MVSATPDGKILPVLASVVPTLANGGISRDGRTITYHLRHGVKWHDGAAFSSRDIVFSQHARVNPANNVTTRTPYSFVAGIDAPDPWTVVVHLHRPYAPFVTQWFPNDGGGIMPAHLLRKVSGPQSSAVRLGAVGTGPFVFDHWERGRESRTAQTNRIISGNQPSTNSSFNSSRREHENRCASGRDRLEFPGVDDVGSQAHRDSRVVTNLLATNAQFGVTLQTRHPPLDDKRVRQANRVRTRSPSLVAKISGKFGIPASSDIGPVRLGVRRFDQTAAVRSQTQPRALRFSRAGTWRRWKLERDGKPLSLLLVYGAGSTAGEAYAVQIQGCSKMPARTSRSNPSRPISYSRPLPTTARCNRKLRSRDQRLFQLRGSRQPALIRVHVASAERLQRIASGATKITTA